MIRINLLGEKKDYSELLRKHLLALIVLLLVFVGGFFTIMQGDVSKLMQYREEKETLDKELTALRNSTKELDDLDKKKKLLHEKLSTISQLRSNKYSAVKFLETLTQTIPERAWLSSIFPNKNGLDLQGIALDEQTVSQFVDKLESSPWVQGIHFGYTKEKIKEEAAVKEFLFSVRVKGMSTESAQLKKK